MGWYGMPGYDRESAFNKLFSQSQYNKKFKLIWHKHLKSKSIVVYSVEGNVTGEIILWSEKSGQLIYKPLSWTDGIEYIPKKFHEELLKNASDLEKECFMTFVKKKTLKDSIKHGTVLKLDSPVMFSNNMTDDTFQYFGKGQVWAVNLKIFVSGITKEYIISKGFKQI